MGEIGNCQARGHVVSGLNRSLAAVSDMCANSKDLLIEQTSDMLTSGGGGRQLTLLCPYCAR